MLRFLKNLFRRRIKVTFHMKSGDRILVRCRDIKIGHVGGELRSFNIVGLPSGGEAFYIRIEDISAITYK